MSRYWQYAACSLLTRSHQNLDKLLVAFVMPEATWVVSMVGYCANLPAMAYEMTTLAALKSRILSFNKSEIADRRRVSRRDVILFALVGIPSAVAAAIFLVLKATDLPLIISEERRVGKGCVSTFK